MNLNEMSWINVYISQSDAINDFRCLQIVRSVIQNSLLFEISLPAESLDVVLKKRLDRKKYCYHWNWILMNEKNEGEEWPLNWDATSILYSFVISNHVICVHLSILYSMWMCNEFAYLAIQISIYSILKEDEGRQENAYRCHSALNWNLKSENLSIFPFIITIPSIQIWWYDCMWGNGMEIMTHRVKHIQNRIKYLFKQGKRR